jgi:hypothetical protein
LTRWLLEVRAGVFVGSCSGPSKHAAGGSSSHATLAGLPMPIRLRGVQGHVHLHIGIYVTPNEVVPRAIPDRKYTGILAEHGARSRVWWPRSVPDKPSARLSLYFTSKMSTTASPVPEFLAECSLASRQIACPAFISTSKLREPDVNVTLQSPSG